jgi:hypothetical protein
MYLRHVCRSASDDSHAALTEWSVSHGVNDFVVHMQHVISDIHIDELTKSNIADTKDTHNANNDQIDGNNIIEQFWLNENEYAGKQGYNRSEGQIHGVSFAGV